ncbi:betaine-aldehyde dehydrogenase [Labedella gwakjiensis]|uniref:Aldehyde dehydrogenase n=1 Tax=Labedella gwakjiensis TaxID=390269 RepID=A0A2P8GXY8_9MICO|nr:aldehyde dehydrogenase family protein [Labedella gwakjiensis]PSL38829.1 betaine-aldehyde dehydrogenase [Labedella gwakjiensis]RUQ86701.1 aldehyde dehydrogenase [Labedella gwakjiensis]
MTTALVNPATGRTFADVPSTSIEETDEAVARALVAQREWARRAPADRAAALRSFAGAVDAAIEELAGLEATNSGHPIGQARWEAGHVRDVLQYYAAAPERLAGAQIPVAGGLDITFHDPVGVVGVITPWNFPMTIASWAFAPALAAGNAVVLKPAEWTPLTSLRLAAIALEAGLPEHLFQVLPGLGPVVGERLVTHPDVRKVVFTGSTATGKRVMALAAEQVKQVTLELGGKSANIVFADSDLERAARTAPSGVFENAGQDCCARSRILVERSVLDRFLELLEPAVAAVAVGDPLDESTEMGPLVSRQHLSKVEGFVPAGAPVAFRGSAPSGDGFWFPPTVLLPSRTDRAFREEIFGPVVSVVPFDDEADAIGLANDSPYGLSGSIWTRDLSRAVRVSRAVESGNLSVNSHSSVRYSTPFGGFKHSGVGRELGPDAPLAFTETKNVFFAIDDAPPSTPSPSTTAPSASAPSEETT